MKLETLLNALDRCWLYAADDIKKRNRQHQAIRDRIIRMDERKNIHIRLLQGAEELQEQRIMELEEELERLA